MFRALIDLHQRRWEERGKPGAFASDVFTGFQHQLLDRYFPAGDGAGPEHAWLVGAAPGDDRPLAGDPLPAARRGPPVRLPVGRGHRHRGHSAALAPGLLLHLHTIDACAADGIAVYDLMAGDYDYKRKLALAGGQPADAGSVRPDRAQPAVADRPGHRAPDQGGPAGGGSWPDLSRRSRPVSAASRSPNLEVAREAQRLQAIAARAKRRRAAAGRPAFAAGCSGCRPACAAAPAGRRR